MDARMSVIAASGSDGDQGFGAVTARGSRGEAILGFSNRTRLWSKIEPYTQLDQTLVAGRSCRVGWWRDDVSSGIHHGGGAQIRHV